MTYIYENYFYNNIFELLDVHLPNKDIATVALIKEVGKEKYDEKTLSYIENFDDDAFFDLDLKKEYNHNDFYKQFNIRIATSEDEKLIYGF
jgi:hypothetical protein